MSWQDRIKQAFTITTHGRSGAITWQPDLIPTFSKNIEYNGTQYEFINRIGSLFARKFPKGKVYQLEFAFQGENHDKEANSFEIECRTQSPIEFSHPVFGKFTAQPMSLEVNASGLSSTIVRMSVIETLVIKSNRIVDIKDAESIIKQSVKKSKSAQITRLTTPKVYIKTTAKDVQFTLGEIKKTNKFAEAVTKTQSEYKKYRKLSEDVYRKIENATSFSETVMQSIQEIIDFPVNLSSDIGQRVKAVNSMLDSLTISIKATASLNYYQKIYYNLFGAACIGSICSTLQIKNSGDFLTKSSVLQQINSLQDSYSGFLDVLYSLEDKNFTPDHDTMFYTHESVCETAFYLYILLFEGKQERTYYPKKDTNVILLSHRLYGSATDENIELLRTTNKIGLSEIINIKKDRAIKYYVS